MKSLIRVGTCTLAAAGLVAVKYELDFLACVLVGLAMAFNEWLGEVKL